MKYSLAFHFSLWTCFVWSQPPALGKWRDLLPYRQINKVAETKNRVYAAGSAGLFYYDKEDNSTQRLSTIQGLLDINITAMAADPDGHVLLIGYQTGEMDIITSDNRLINNRHIATSNIIGNKQINHFYFYNGYCYVATGFGVLLFDYTKLEFPETFLLGESGSYVHVKHLTAHQDHLFAATSDGLYSCSFNVPMFNPANWHRNTIIPGRDSVINYVFSFSDNLYVNLHSDSFKNDIVYSKINNDVWIKHQGLSGQNNFHFDVRGSKLLVSNWDQLVEYDYFLVPSRVITSTDGSGFIFPRYAIFGSDGNIWVGDWGSGLIEINDGGNKIINLEGPVSDKAFNLFHLDGKLFVAGGGHPQNWFPFYNLPELSVLREDDSWEVYNSQNTIGLKDYRDVIAVAVNPIKPKHYAVATLRQGIFILESGKGFVEAFDPSNSPLDTTQGGVCVISDITYDKDGNLWIVNSQTPHPLKVLTTDNKWVLMPASLNGSSFKTGKFLITSNNQVWVGTLNDGIVVYDYKKTLTDVNDDGYRFLNFAPGSGNLPDNQINALAEDTRGQIWVGTRSGMRVFTNTSNVLSTSFNDAKDVYIQQDGQTQILFENQDISAIKIDGANRKWFGTRGSGIFLMNEDGTKEVLHFDRKNSPVFSDFINDITLHPASGEVYFATAKGLIAYRGNAPESSDLSEILAFPNPVKRNYQGKIGISGLADKAVVKISDVAGNLIFETEATGGMAIWDGLDLRGKRPGPGAYLILCISKDGENKGSTKILFEP